jgi:putative alpha-1,2-mannosidase
MTSLGFSGFLGPRNQTAFLDQDPLSCGGCYWGDAYYEALPWEYSFNAHHDIDSLIALSGGEQTFVQRLEMMFTPGKNPHGSPAFNSTIFNPGNEPSFTTPFLYNFVGRQDLTVLRSRTAAKAYYQATPGGLPGNSDAGAMESWVLWVMLGLYPMTGQTTFLIGSPWFSDLTIALGDGKSLKITTTGGSDTSFYVQSLKVNGKPWTQSWVTWADVFQRGGTMDFVLGPNPANWTTGPPPPSPASEFGRNATSQAILGGSQSNALPAGTERGGDSKTWATVLIAILVGFVVLMAAVTGLCLLQRRRQAGRGRSKMTSSSPRWLAGKKSSSSESGDD